MNNRQFLNHFILVIVLICVQIIFQLVWRHWTPLVPRYVQGIASSTVMSNGILLGFVLKLFFHAKKLIREGTEDTPAYGNGSSAPEDQDPPPEEDR